MCGCDCHREGLRGCSDCGCDGYGKAVSPTPNNPGPLGLPPYSGDDARCPKCGHGDISTIYRKHGNACRGRRDAGENHEHLNRHCRRCRYDWDEATVDTR